MDMMDKIVVAKLTHEGKEYVGKREIELYDEKSKVNATLLKHANQGLRLDIQRQIRNVLAIKNGLKRITAGGEAVDLSNIESV